MTDKLKPGDKAPKTGKYGVFDANGNNTGQEKSVSKDEHLPPTSKPGEYYKLLDGSHGSSHQK